MHYYIVVSMTTTQQDIVGVKTFATWLY